MSGKKNILILCTDNYQSQPRVLRTIEALSSNYNITVAGYSKVKEHSIHFIDLSENLKKNQAKENWHFNKPALIRLPVSFYHKYVKQKQFYKPLFFELQYWTSSALADLERLQKEKYDLIISHGVNTMPLAVKLSGNKIPVVFNAHEYYPLEFEQDKNWLKNEGARAKYILNKYLPQCSMMFCVSEQIQKEYQKDHNINSIVISNATSFNELSPKIVNSPIKIIHHGAALRARQIEVMANVMNLLNSEYELTFMLTPAEPDYLEELKEKYKTNPKIKFIAPVAVSEISKECNKYDIGLFILPPVNYNWVNALPNKIFEFIQGRLCLAVSPNIEMKSMVEKYDLGIISPEYSSEAMADKIKSLSKEDVLKFKQNSNSVAKELSGETNKQKMLQVVNNLLEN